RVAISALPWIDGNTVDEAETLDLVVVGEHKKDLMVDDGSGALNLISPKELAIARAMRKKEKHWQAWIPSSRSPKAETLAANAVEAIGETTARLLGTSELSGVPVHFAKNFGITGMRTLATRLRDNESKTGWSQIFASQQALANGLDQLAGFFSDTRFSGEGALRGLYAEFLSEAAELPGLAPLAAHVDAYRQLSTQWDAFADLIDPETEFAKRAEHFAVLADAIERIADSEEQAATSLAVTAKKLASKAAR
ncbi:MAG: DUF4872 domain-containing protein, partial [Glutamicibacter sp.]